MKKIVFGIVAFVAFIVSLYVVGVAFASCGGAAQKPTTEQIEAAATIGCNLIESQTTCLEDAQVQAAFPGLAPENCGERITYLIEIAEDATKIRDELDALIVLSKVDLKKVNYLELVGLKDADCKIVKNALGL